MRKEITRIEGQSVGKLLGVIYAVLGLVFGLIFAITLLGSGGSVAVALAVLIGFPLLYGVLGFLSAYILAIIYNVCAKKIGGVAYHTRELSAAEQTSTI